MVHELQLLWGHLCKAETREHITSHLMWACLAHSWASLCPPGCLREVHSLCVIPVICQGPPKVHVLKFPPAG